ncbi:MAG: sensor domain-containing diguanylate cyclase, partial [Deltaproteobacteria bacterium]|nr:sensor domain-containing diguanylate cyclase [Deltaproteobacteria bacterium]
AETLDLTARLVPSEAGSLLLDDPTVARARSPLTFIAAFGAAAPQLVGRQVPRGHGIVGHVYKSGQIYTTGGPEHDPHFFEQFDAAAGFHTRSVVAAPVRLENHVCGVFELINRRGRATFSARDIEVVELLGSYISRAILNSVDLVKQSELALRDELTGLGNVRGLHPDLEDAVRRAKKNREDLAVLFIDVDRLKALNDRRGHRAGSEALRRIGAILQTTTEAEGCAYRFGGDEFVVILPGHDAKNGTTMADRIRKAVAKGVRGPMRHGGSIPKLTVSIGVATLDAALAPGRATAAKKAARLLAAADHALYRAKRQGRNRSAKATRRDDKLR